MGTGFEPGKKNCPAGKLRLDTRLSLRRSGRPRAGITLIELLIVIAIIGVLVGMVIPKSDPGIHEQLRAAAQILRTDLAYARSLAITNNSTYRIIFRPSANAYYLLHSGTDAALDTLPTSPFRNPDDPSDKHIVRLADLPNMGSGVELVAVGELGGAPSSRSKVEFNSLGETTRAKETTIWLGAGTGESRRYLPLTVNPVTGLVEVGDYAAEGPPAAVLPAVAASPTL